MRPVFRCNFLVALSALMWALASSHALAADFKSVGPGPAIMYDAPTQKSRKLHIAPVGMPVEIVFANGDWVRVRDAVGELSWMENRSLTPLRTVIVEVTQANIRASAADSAAVVFNAAKGVVLELAEPPASGWIKVKHRDGDTGYLRAIEVWGE
ncbi:MAG: SH3 domain-containing protein [bacterium]|jgi:SH3-like domain-containing protein